MRHQRTTQLLITFCASTYREGTVSINFINIWSLILFPRLTELWSEQLYTHPLDDKMRTQMSKPSSPASEFMSEVLPLNEAFSTLACLPCLDTVVPSWRAVQQIPTSEGYTFPNI
jgi:hypothetical protein